MGYDGVITTEYQHSCTRINRVREKEQMIWQTQGESLRGFVGGSFERYIIYMKCLHLLNSVTCSNNIHTDILIIAASGKETHGQNYGRNTVTVAFPRLRNCTPSTTRSPSSWPWPRLPSPPLRYYYLLLLLRSSSLFPSSSFTPSTPLTTLFTSLLSSQRSASRPGLPVQPR